MEQINKKIFILLAIFPLISGCIENFDFDADSVGGQLVVEGLITDQNELQQIRLSRAFDFDTTVNQFVDNAIVSVSDDMGNVYNFTNAGNGMYISDELVGAVGRSYKLSFRTSDGNFYESNFQMMKAVPEISSIYYERGTKQTFNEAGVIVDEDIVEIFVDTKNFESDPATLLLDWEAIYEIRTFPEDNAFFPTGMGAPAICFDPLPCSGYEVTEFIPLDPDVIISVDSIIMVPLTEDSIFFVQKDTTFFIPRDSSFLNCGNEIEQVDECTCCNCWRTVFNPNVLLNENESRNLKRFKVAEFQALEEIFGNKFRFIVNQFSLTNDAFVFYRSLKLQRENTGSIFETPPFKINSNIMNIDNEDEDVLGFFTASAMKSDSIEIIGGELSNLIPFEDLTIDCRNFPNSSNVRPENW
ncbi:MAG TPA: DUF4249 domain-containing protein [Cyclobacteriaceae bacterium]